MAEPEKLARVIEWAENTEDIRAVLLIGSRADPNAAIDALSDFDLILFLDDEPARAARDDWLEEFGSVLVMLREKTRYLDYTVPTRLVQYRDGTRVDFTLAPTEILRRLTEMEKLPAWLDRGYRVLVDKDRLAKQLSEPTHSAYVPEKPSESVYRQLIEEFWWESLYVAKHLARGEMLPAKYSGECVLRFDCLVPMLEWYVQRARGWESPLGPHGRELTALLAGHDRDAVDRTFAGSDPGDNWDALFAMAGLFRRAARSVAEELGFSYPEHLDRDTEAYLRKIRARSS